eukprot:39279-Rhodomonas_salina.1
MLSQSVPSKADTNRCIIENAVTKHNVKGSRAKSPERSFPPRRSLTQPGPSSRAGCAQPEIRLKHPLFPCNLYQERVAKSNSGTGHRVAAWPMPVPDSAQDSRRERRRIGNAIRTTRTRIGIASFSTGHRVGNA